MLPFGWTESEAQAWSAIVQAGAAVVILVLTAVAVWQTRRSGDEQRQRAAEDRVASAALPRLTALWSHVFDGSTGRLSVRFDIENVDRIHALNVTLTVRTVEDAKAPGRNDAKWVVDFGDLGPTDQVDREEVPPDIITRPDNWRNGRRPYWAPQLVLGLQSRGVRGETVYQRFYWAPEGEGDASQPKRTMTVIDPNVRGVKHTLILNREAAESDQGVVAFFP